MHSNPFHHKAAIMIVAIPITMLSALAQQPLQLSVQSALGQRTIATVTNGYNRSATMFLLVLKRFNSAGVQKVEFQRHVDSLVNLPEKPLQPGATTSIDLGFPFPNSSKPDQVELKAAIFSDGKAFGDPVWIGKVLTRRRVLRDTLGKMIELCSTIKSGETGQAFAKRFVDYETQASGQLGPEEGMVVE
ncbi:MAG: hypothetical protein M3Z85_05175, partial [Acidobacteriota bacterium]|nr:hypothetical protein [Acidobacteriota bacterium]